MQSCEDDMPKWTANFVFACFNIHVTKAKNILKHLHAHIRYQCCSVQQTLEFACMFVHIFLEVKKFSWQGCWQQQHIAHSRSHSPQNCHPVCASPQWLSRPLISLTVFQRSWLNLSTAPTKSAAKTFGCIHPCGTTKSATSPKSLSKSRLKAFSLLLETMLPF